MSQTKKRPKLFELVFSEGVAVSLLLIGAILVLLLIFLYSYKSGIFSWSDQIDANRITSLADAIGGIVGSLWSLSGVILFFLALENQKENFKLNKKAVDQQIRTLELQTNEFREQRVEFERAATAQENSEKQLKLQFDLMRRNSIIDKYATLARVNSDLAKLETNKAIQKEYKIICKKYIDKLETVKDQIKDE